MHDGDVPRRDGQVQGGAAEDDVLLAQPRLQSKTTRGSDADVLFPSSITIAFHVSVGESSPNRVANACRCIDEPCCAVK